MHQRIGHIFWILTKLNMIKLRGNKYLICRKKYCIHGKNHSIDCIHLINLHFTNFYKFTQNTCIPLQNTSYFFQTNKNRIRNEISN